MTRSLRPISVLLIASLIPATTALCADPPAAPSAAIARRLTTLIPAGWTVIQEGNTVTIQRDAQALVMNTAPNPPPNQKSIVGKVVLMLDILPPTTTAQLAQWQKINDDKDTALHMLETQLKGLEKTMPSGYDNGYRAQNADQQKLLDAYIAVNRDLPHHAIPTLFAKDGSALWVSLYSQPSEPAVQKEKADLVKVIESAFTPQPQD